MAAPFPNLYTLRKVAESAAKACDVCYKPSSSVLITPDKKDFFYICPVHLKDQYFCTPKIDEDAIKAKREKDLAEEKEKLMKAYQEKQRKKKEKEKEREKEKEKEKDKGKDKDKDKDGDKGKDKDKDKETEKTEGKDETEANKDGTETPKEEDEPRVFELKSSFYQQRLQRKRQAEVAKRDRERASQPNYFPSVPTEPPRK